MKKFIYYSLLDVDNICNLGTERKQILQILESGRKLVIYGRRNSGKTSLVKNAVIPDFKKKHKSSLVVFCDFQGVKSLDDISIRLCRSFGQAFVEAFPIKARLLDALEMVKSLRPKIEMDPVSGISMTFGVESKSNEQLSNLFSSIGKLSQHLKIALVFDEFQDVAEISQAEAILRDAWQNLPASIPIVVLGSKKHLLAKIFTVPNAPFADWGENLEFKPISYDEYHVYIDERFRANSLTISFDDCCYLQNLVSRIPEAINILCAFVLEYRNGKAATVTKEMIHGALKLCLDQSASRFEEYLKNFTENEIDFLAAMAKFQPIKEPNGKAFVSKTKISQKGVNGILHKLLNGAIIYDTSDGFELSNPLLAHYLKRYR